MSAVTKIADERHRRFIRSCVVRPRRCVATKRVTSTTRSFGCYNIFVASSLSRVGLRRKFVRRKLIANANKPNRKLIKSENARRREVEGRNPSRRSSSRRKNPLARVQRRTFFPTVSFQRFYYSVVVSVVVLARYFQYIHRRKLPRNLTFFRKWPKVLSLQHRPHAAVVSHTCLLHK